MEQSSAGPATTAVVRSSSLNLAGRAGENEPRMSLFGFDREPSVTPGAAVLAAYGDGVSVGPGGAVVGGGALGWLGCVDGWGAG